MKANTAVGIGLAAAAIWLNPVLRFRWLSAVFGLVLFALGVATFSQELTGTSLGIDQLLFVDPATTLPRHPGRMAMTTALAFSALGPSIILLAVGKGPRAISAAHLLTTVPASVAFIVLTFGVEALYALYPLASVSVLTAISLSALTVAALATRADEGLLWAFRERPVARRSLLRILFVSSGGGAGGVLGPGKRRL